jgi:hypothetical protein
VPKKLSALIDLCFSNQTVEVGLEHPEVPPDNNGSEHELRPTATYRKVPGGFRSSWGADLFAGFDPSLAPHHDAETTRIRLFAPTWMGNPSFSPVEQIRVS